MNLLFYSNILLICLFKTSTLALNDHKCSEPIERSAVTKEAADAAAKVLDNPPVISNELYSSKVKSKDL